VIEQDGDKVADLSEARSLPGRHNAQNAAFAYAAARRWAFRMTPPSRADDLPGPRPPHGRGRPARQGPLHQRLQGHQRRRGASGAVQSYERSFWIAGGRAKHGGIDELEELFPRVVAAYLIGESAEDRSPHRLGDVPHRISGDMASAVEPPPRTPPPPGARRWCC
jgi:UDP-N-acetylmuramoylalanine--D-glutamate ligase